MSFPIPEGEELHRAVKWISQQLQAEPEQKLWPLINEATTKFDLNPRDAEYLIHFYQKNSPK
jgi:hypothetical protein